MSSVIGQKFNQVPFNSLYTNLIAVNSSIVDSNNNVVAWVVSPSVGQISTAGAAVFRDMGRQIYLPNPTVPTAVGSQSTILRRVQVITQGTNGYYGTGDNATSVQGSDTDFYCGYIKLGAQTFAGGSGVAPGFVKLN